MFVLYQHALNMDKAQFCCILSEKKIQIQSPILPLYQQYKYQENYILWKILFLL